jgi:transcriptional regulator with XRE-family HTH domain
MLLLMATVTRAKRRLGAFLLELRGQTGRTTIDAAAELKTSDSTVSRYESGHVLPVWSTVLTLLRYYDASEPEHKRATQLWEDAKDEAPPVRLPAGTPKSFRRLVSAEREAETIRAIELSVVPGLLQSGPYAQALVDAAHQFRDPEKRVDGLVSRRLTRQQLLQAPDPLKLHVVLDEAAIRRIVGGPDVMRDQLEHLLTMGLQTNITLQVMPYDRGAYGTMSGPCTILGYTEPDETPGVYLEYPAGGAWVENEKDVQRFTTMFEDAVRAALSPADTADLIREQIRALTNYEHHEVAEE